ncbi:hypothetical protein [Vibrio cincinnatiensis]|uniref:hypothetical protein n=1 Tax=Vibrio cincinnatiensis TaxID=675 RepID=UPI001EDEACE7|nr:hypothetical protein [Vibrio cincinnatiensis]MCG3728991.1 ATP-binding protein [Vibrio cincinnatiensis]
MAKKPQIRLPPPRNSNQALNAEHVVYIGTTGSGKTTAVKKMGLVPKGSQAAFFDPYENYSGKRFQGQQVRGFREFGSFAKALVAGRSGKKPFKVALIKEATPENVEMFARIIWALGDGLKPQFHVVIEELASASETAGKLQGKAGELWRGGRQYGLVMHACFQRPQEVPKTVISQSPNWWVGALQSSVDAKYISDARGVPITQLASLKSAKFNKGIAEYLLVGEGIGNIKQGQINCKT